MKTVLLSVGLAAVVWACAGCAMSDEDKEFYGRGWIKPTELDAPAVHHSTADPNETANAPSAPRRTPEPEPPFLTPETGH